MFIGIRNSHVNYYYKSHTNVFIEMSKNKTVQKKSMTFPIFQFQTKH